MFLQNVFTPAPGFRHEVLAVAVDRALDRALVHCRIRGTPTGEGLPVPPTGRSMVSDCVLTTTSRSTASVASRRSGTTAR